MNFASCWPVKRTGNDGNEVLMPVQMQDKQTTRFAWRRWIDPLRAAIEEGNAPLDTAAFEADLAALDGAGDGPFARQLLAIRAGP